MADLWQKIEAEIPRLRRYARALTRNPLAADDLVQDCLLRALDKSHLWQEGSDLRAWLFTILHNQYVNQVRRAVHEQNGVPIDRADLPLSTGAAQEARLELRDLDRALAQLPDDQRTVILLTGLEGMSYEAVAEMISVPLGTVRSRLSRGREALRQLMQVEPETAEHPVAHQRRPNARSRVARRRVQARKHRNRGQSGQRAPSAAPAGRVTNSVTSR